MIGERIKQARKAAGLNQQQVADAIGVSRSTFTYYETGKRTPDALMITKIAKAIHVTGDFILDIEIEKEKPVQMDEPFEEFEGLNAENREKVRSFAAYLLSQQSEP